MKNGFCLLSGIILMAILLAGAVIFIGNKGHHWHRSLNAPEKSTKPPQTAYAYQTDAMTTPTPAPTPEPVDRQPQKSSPASKTAVRIHSSPRPAMTPDETSRSFHHPDIIGTPEPNRDEQPATNPETGATNQTVIKTPVPVAVKPSSTPPPALVPDEKPPIPESRLKIACDFESLGLGYEIFRREKISVDGVIYTDKAGIGVSYRFVNGIHLGVDNTYKYQNGERQLRIYCSMAIRPGE